MSKGVGRHSREVDAEIPSEDRAAFLSTNAVAVVSRKNELIARHRREIHKLLLAKAQLRKELQKARARISELESRP